MAKAIEILGETYNWKEDDIGWILERRLPSGEFSQVASIYWSDSASVFILEAPGWVTEHFDALNVAKLDIEELMRYCRYGEEHASDDCEQYRAQGSEFCPEHSEVNRLHEEWQDKAHDLARRYDKEARDYEIEFYD